MINEDFVYEYLEGYAEGGFDILGELTEDDYWKELNNINKNMSGIFDIVREGFYFFLEDEKKEGNLTEREVNEYLDYFDENSADLWEYFYNYYRNYNEDYYQKDKEEI